MKKIVPLLLFLLLAFPALAQYSPNMKPQAIAAMSLTPLAGMDRESSLLIASMSYECAAYYNGMTMVAEQLNELGRLDDDFELETFVVAGRQMGMFHIALAEMIHIIYDITEEQDMAIMMAQGEKIQDALNGANPQDLDDTYEPQCLAIRKTYLPTIFKEEVKNGA